MKSGHENADEVKEKCEVGWFGDESPKEWRGKGFLLSDRNSIISHGTRSYRSPSFYISFTPYPSLIQDLKDRWDRLRDLAKARRKKLEDAQESHTYYADANEAESWIREKMPLAKDDDYGKDEATARSLLNRYAKERLAYYAIEVDSMGHR